MNNLVSNIFYILFAPYIRKLIKLSQKKTKQHKKLLYGYFFCISGPRVVVYSEYCNIYIKIYCFMHEYIYIYNNISFYELEKKKILNHF